MIRKINENEFEKYIDFAYALAMDLSHASFPIFTDGVKTKEYFYEVSKRGITRENHEILLFEKSGVIEGWIHYYYISEDKYLSVNNLLIQMGYAEALRELLEYWKANFQGYTWHMYFPKENQDAISFMEENGFSKKSMENVDVLLFNDYTIKCEPENVVQIGLENFVTFSDIHTQFENDMYWTSDRIAETMEEWEIFAYIHGEKCVGVLYHNGKGEDDLEIFGIDMLEGSFEKEVIESLLVACLNKAKKNGAKSMYFFNEDKTMHEIAIDEGFKGITVAYYFSEKV